MKQVFEYKITFWICVLVLWIHKGYCVVKKLVWNVGINGIQINFNLTEEDPFNNSLYISSFSFVDIIKYMKYWQFYFKKWHNDLSKNIVMFYNKTLCKVLILLFLLFFTSFIDIISWYKYCNDMYRHMLYIFTFYRKMFVVGV